MSVEFEVPARAEYVSLVRMLAATLAGTRRLVDEERVDNLKLAVSEACTLFVEAAGSETRRLTMTWQEDDDALMIDVDDGREGNPLAEAERLDEAAVVPFQIMRALVDDVGFVTNGGIGHLRLRMLCPPV